jgi:hypothetical protein
LFPPSPSCHSLHYSCPVLLYWIEAAFLPTYFLLVNRRKMDLIFKHKI